MKELREWANLILTIVAVFFAGYLNLRFSNQKLEIEAAASQRYETREGHDADMHQLTDWNRKLSEGQQDQKLAIQHLTDVMAVRRGDGTPRNPTQNN